MCSLYAIRESKPVIARVDSCAFLDTTNDVAERWRCCNLTAIVYIEYILKNDAKRVGVEWIVAYIKPVGDTAICRCADREDMFQLVGCEFGAVPGSKNHLRKV